MQITIGQAIRAYPVLDRLAGQSMRARTADRIRRARNALREHVRRWDEHRVEALQRHGAADNGDGTLDTSQCDMQSVTAELNELMAEQVEVDVTHVTLDALDEAGVSGDDLDAIEWMIEESD